MNKGQFISYIESPEKISGSDSLLLAELLKNFPYFQTAHLLYAKGLHNAGSIHYNNQLKVTAAYAADRKVLHRLITKQKEAETDTVLPNVLPERTAKIEEERIEAAVEQIVKTEVKEFNIKPVVEETLLPEPEIEIIPVPSLVQAEEKVIEKVLERIQEEKTAEEKEHKNEPEEIVDPEDEHKAQESENPEEATDPLEGEYISEIVDASVEIELLNTPLFEPQEAKTEEKQQEIVESNFVLSTIAEVPVEKTEVSSTINQESLSFTDWLKHMN